MIATSEGEDREKGIKRRKIGAARKETRGTIRRE